MANLLVQHRGVDQKQCETLDLVCRRSSDYLARYALEIRRRLGAGSLNSLGTARVLLLARTSAVG